MWFIPPFGIIGDNMAKRNLELNNPAIKRVVAILLLEMAGMAEPHALRILAQDTITRQIYYMVGDGIAIELWKQMKNMGGSVSG